ncbi:MAG TPA: hypothetical protein DCE42_27630 [Myxococcales bacterium]|nr:hypothetical protein [Myxococcales bacterium]
MAEAHGPKSHLLQWSLIFLLGIGVGGGGVFFALQTSTNKTNTPSQTTKSTQPLNPTTHTPKSYPRSKGYTKRVNRPLGLQHALLLNGGGNPQSNYFSHHLHLQMFSELLKRRGLAVDEMSLFSTDGTSPKKDRLVAIRRPKDWLFEGLPEAQLMDASKLVNTTMPGMSMRPAKKRSLAQWFHDWKKTSKGQKSQTLMFFVTDHGTRGKGPLGNKIELWGEQVNVKEVRDMMKPLGKETRVVSVMSQCYSGGFANLLYEEGTKVHGNRCGFFSTLSSREAYGCFPETARAERVGHAYRMIRAMRRARTFVEAHEMTLLTDRTPDVPLRTSDVFLRDIVRRAAKKEDTTFHVFVDSLLKKIWAKPPALVAADIALLQRVQRSFDLPQLTTLRAVWEAIQKSRKRLQSIRAFEGWKNLDDEVRQRMLIRFYQRDPGLGHDVEKEMKRPDLDEQTAKIGTHLYNAYIRYLRKHKAINKRLTSIYTHKQRLDVRTYQLQVREAALLRLHTLLIRIAGRVWMMRHGRASQKADLKALLECEQTSLGNKPVEGALFADGVLSKKALERQRQKQKQYAQLRRLDDQSLMPSWLGIVFQPLREGWHAKFEKLAPGASQVVEVGSNTPAEEAGVLPGDIVVSFDGGMLLFSNEIRERVMMASPKKKHYMMVYRRGRFKTLTVTLKRRKLQQDSIGGAGGPDWEPDGQEPNTRVFGLRRSRPNAPQKRETMAPLMDIDGKALSVTNAKGPTMLFFWATWCAGCKAMVPMLRKLYQRYERKGFRILAVTTDDMSELKPFLARWGKRFPFTVARDTQGMYSRRYKIDTIPQLILFDHKGKQRLHFRRMPDQLASTLDKQIRGLLLR